MIYNIHALPTLDHEISSRSAVCPLYLQNGLVLNGPFPCSSSMSAVACKTRSIGCVTKVYSLDIQPNSIISEIILQLSYYNFETVYNLKGTLDDKTI